MEVHHRRPHERDRCPSPRPELDDAARASRPHRCCESPSADIFRAIVATLSRLPARVPPLGPCSWATMPSRSRIRRERRGGGSVRPHPCASRSSSSRWQCPSHPSGTRREEREPPRARQQSRTAPDRDTRRPRRAARAMIVLHHHHGAKERQQVRDLLRFSKRATTRNLVRDPLRFQRLGINPQPRRNPRDQQEMLIAPDAALSPSRPPDAIQQRRRSSSTRPPLRGQRCPPLSGSLPVARRAPPCRAKRRGGVVQCGMCAPPPAAAASSVKTYGRNPLTQSAFPEPNGKFVVSARMPHRPPTG